MTLTARLGIHLACRPAAAADAGGGPRASATASASATATASTSATASATASASATAADAAPHVYVDHLTAGLAAASSGAVRHDPGPNPSPKP